MFPANLQQITEVHARMPICRAQLVWTGILHHWTVWWEVIA